MLRNSKRRLVAKAGAIAGVTAGLFTLTAPSAFGAATITNPSSPFTPATQAAPFTFAPQIGLTVPGGAPLPFNMTMTGNTPNQNFVGEICDGNNPTTTPAWSPTFNCDQVAGDDFKTTDSNGNVSWDVSNGADQILVFRGESPSDIFNCVASTDVPAGFVNGSDPPATDILAHDGSNNTAAGESGTPSPIDPGVAAWTNCQLRISSNDAAVTTDQVFATFTLQDAPGAETPQFPYAIVAPIGAVGILGAGLFFARRRRHSAVAA